MSTPQLVFRLLLYCFPAFHPFEWVDCSLCFFLTDVPCHWLLGLFLLFQLCGFPYYCPHRSLLSSPSIKTSSEHWTLDIAYLAYVLAWSVPCSCNSIYVLLSFNSFQLIVQSLYCLSFHSRHHPLRLPLRCLVLYLVVFFSCCFPNIQYFFLLPNRALCLIIPPPAFKPCFLLIRFRWRSVFGLMLVLFYLRHGLFRYVFPRFAVNFYISSSFSVIFL